MARTRLPRSLSPRLRALMEPHLAPDESKLASIGLVIAGRRQEAVNARKASGIEEVWLGCEEAYVSIDNANRHEFMHSRWAKSMSPDGPLTKETAAPGDGKSTIFVPITARYVDAGSAKLSEILLPLDDKAFSFTETPLPDLIDLKESSEQVVSPTLGVPLTRDARPEEVPQNPAGPQPLPTSGQPAAVPAPADGAVLPAGAAAPPQVPLTAKDIAEEQLALARKKAKKAEKRIYDWMVECQHAAEAEKAIFDGARLGVGILKGPIPMPKREVVASKTDAGVEVVIRDTVKPGDRWVDPWNFFPDPACGENVHNGDHCFERDFFSEHQVRNLLKEPGYIAAQVEKVIAEGPGGIKNDDADKPNKPADDQRRKQYEIWYFYGVLSRDDYWCICHAAGAIPKGDLGGQVFAIVTMINDHVVKAAFNPLDSGALPYHAVPWRRRPGHWAGIGVAEQVSSAQRITNASVRAMMNNAGLASGAQIVINRDALSPSDGKWNFVPNKIWIMEGDANMPVEDAFGMFAVPNTTAALNDIVQLGMRLAEESTNIPLVTQGQSGPTQPNTFGGLQLQNNNANQLLRQVARTFDDYITEPMVRQYYEYLLLDPDVPDDEKGDFAINAHGSAALVERAIQDEMLGQMLPASLNPAYGLNPRKTMKEFLKSKRFDPRQLENTEEEQAKIDSQPPPKPYQVDVANINAQSREKIAAGTAEIDKGELILEAHRVRDENAARARELQNQVDDLKVRLAETTMKLETQKQLAERAAAAPNGPGKRIRSQRVPQVAPAAIEPAGRAANGRAFEQ